MCSASSTEHSDIMSIVLTRVSLAYHIKDIGNSVDADQTPQNAVSDQGLHRLHLIQEFL